MSTPAWRISSAMIGRRTIAPMSPMKICMPEATARLVDGDTFSAGQASSRPLTPSAPDRGVDALRRVDADHREERARQAAAGRGGREEHDVADDGDSAAGDDPDAAQACDVREPSPQDDEGERGRAATVSSASLRSDALDRDGEQLRVGRRVTELSDLPRSASTIDQGLRWSG